MAQSMDSYNALYLSLFLFGDQTVLLCGETFISHSLAKRKKKQNIVTSLSHRKRCANVKNDLCKQTSKGAEKEKLSKETQKQMIPCLHWATVQASDRVWKRCGMTSLSSLAVGMSSSVYNSLSLLGLL